MTDEEVDRTFGGSSSSFVKAEETTAQRFSALQTQLLCAAIHFFHRHIRSDADVLQRMEGNEMFRLFFEVSYHNKPGLNRIFPESVHDCSALHVCSFILSILHQGIFSVSAFIVSVIYLSRFKESSRITLHACTWRPLFLTSLLLADKMWEDKPVRNSSLAKLFPVLSNVELNRMESQFLDEIKFNVLVKPDLFCSFCEKLLAEQVHQEISRCVTQSEYAVTLQAEGGEPLPKVNGKPHVEEPARANGVTHMAVQAEQERAPVSIHEVPATWMEAMPRGRSQSPTAVKPGPLACDVQFAQPYQPHDSGRPLVIPARAAPPDGPIGPEEMFRGAMAQPMRRSLPASSSQYMMLARAPSVGARCVKVPAGENGGQGGSVLAFQGMAVSPRSPPPSAGLQTPPALAVAPGPVPGRATKPRSSSAPRVANVTYAPGGANVRASSQPMHPMIRQVQPHVAQFSGGQQYPRQVLDARAVSPAVTMARAPVTRSTLGGYPARPGISAPSSGPTAAMCHVKPVSSRGRSPVPLMSQGPLRARAATPTAVMKHHVVPRNSLAAQIHPGYVGGPPRAQ